MVGALLPVYAFGIWTRTSSPALEIPEVQAVAIAITAPLIGWAVFVLGALIIRRSGQYSLWVPPALWAVTGLAISTVGNVLRSLASDSAQWGLAAPLQYSLFSMMIVGTTVYGLAALTSRREQLNVLRQQRQRLEGLKAEAAAFAVDQTNNLMETAVDVIVPEVERLRREASDLGDAPSVARLENLRAEVSAYATGVVRAMSHELAGAATDTPSRAETHAPPKHKSPLRSFTRASDTANLILSARTNTPLTIVAALLLFIAQFNNGCTGIPAAAAGSFLVVMLLAGLLGRAPVLTQKPWSFWWLLTTSIVAFAVFRLVISAGGPTCTWVTQEWELLAANAVAVLALLAMSAIFEGSRQIAAVGAETRQVNIELADETERLQAAGSVTQEQVALLLHGPVQGRLAAIALALNIHVQKLREDEAPSPVELSRRINRLLDEVESDLDALLETSSHQAVAIRPFLESLSERWRGLVTVTFTVDSGVDECLHDNARLGIPVMDALEEGVSNASRHGSADVVSIALRCTSDAGGTLEATVVDNGVGPEADPSAGFGLNSMTSRGAMWSLRSGDRGGAKLTIRWPVTQADN